MILTVSDLHLDYSDKEDISALFRLLRENRHRFNTIILNGDLFDSPSRNSSNAVNLEKFLSFVIDMASTGVKFYYVVGNHDLGMTALVGKYKSLNLKVVYPEVTLRLGNKRLFFEHGHRHDPLFKASIYDLLKIIEERGNFRAGDVIEKFGRIFFSHFQTKQKENFGVPESIKDLWNERAKEILQNSSVDAVFFGHTHAADIVTFDNGKIYLNCGSWYENKNYALITRSGVGLYAKSKRGFKLIMQAEF